MFVEVYRSANQIEVQSVRLLLGGNGIRCVLIYEGEIKVMVQQSMAKEAKRLIEEEGHV